MAIPDYETLMLPLLRRVADGPKHIRQLIGELSDEFGLSAEERAVLIPSGGIGLMANRTHWAKTYLKQAGIVAQPSRGMVAITDRGRTLLAEQPPAIDNATLMRFPEFLEFRARRRDTTNADPDPGPTSTATAGLQPAPSRTPEERILAAADEIEFTLGDELLTRLKAGPPAFFERVVVDLLRALGYGDGSGGTSQVTGATGDGGIDGVIDEDRLGLDRIYVQAKRYGEQVVTVDAIRAFSGALDDKGARKGVFLTTSRFSRDAVAYADRQQSKRIVLIDGERLAALMIRHGVGVRTDRTIEIRKIDLDYFEPDDA